MGCGGGFGGFGGGGVGLGDGGGCGSGSAFFNLKGRFFGGRSSSPSSSNRFFPLDKHIFSLIYIRDNHASD